MIRKIISIFLALVLLFSFAGVNVFAAGTVVSIETPTALPKAGDEFTVSINISGNTGIGAAQFTLVFDKTKLDCESVSLGTVLKGSLSAVNPDASDGAIVAAASTGTLSGNGQLASYKFKALKDITSWDFKLKDMILADSSGTDLTYTVSGVTVETDTNQTKTETTNTETTKSTEQKSETSVTTDSTVKTETTKTEESQKTDSAVSTSFTDTKGHWAEDYIAKAVEYGLFKGNSDGSFGPNKNITRAQYVTVLYRKAGSPDVDVEVPFTDTKTQLAEFQKAIAWAYSKGYVNGKDTTHFDPNGSITRQEAMKILFGYSGGTSGTELMYTSVYDSGFSDSSSISSWAKPAVYWAYYNKLISGMGNNALAPKATASRAQLAKILVEYIEKVESQGGE